MIDRLENLFRDAGLDYPLHQLEVRETDYLPEPAGIQGNIVYRAKGVSEDQFLRSAVAAIATKVYKELDEEHLHKWTYALFYLTPTTGTMVQNALATSTQGFKEAVESLGSPVARLSAIHCFNALIKAGTSYADAKTINLAQWGNTSDFITGKRACSLLPLLGAYAPQRLYAYFPDAVVSLIFDRLKEVTHTEVRSKFSEVIRSVFKS
jgi:hypothetical protein